MPFDASGNFTRVYNFVQDAANGIKILAARVDGEFDNIATGMNLVFFRDGRVPMQADLRMNINGITGLKDGALGSPAIKFNTDPNSGPYLDGLNRYAIQVNSVQRGVFTSAGLDITGTLGVSGVISQGGAPVATQAYVAGLNYAALASPALTGTPTAPTAAAGTNTTQLATTAFVQGGYYPLTGGTLNGSITVAGGNVIVGTNSVPGAGVYLNSASGNLRTFAFQTAGVYAGDISLQANDTDIKYNSNGGKHTFSVTGTSFLNIDSSGVNFGNGYVNGALGSLKFQARDASNNISNCPILYSPTNRDFRINDGQGVDMAQFTNNGSTFSGITKINGTGSGITCVIDDHLNASGSNIQLTGNGATTPNKTIRVTSGQLQVANSAYSAIILSLDDTGNLVANGNISSNGARIPNSTVSASAPSGGQNGDLWFQL